MDSLVGSFNGDRYFYGHALCGAFDKEKEASAMTNDAALSWQVIPESGARTGTSLFIQAKSISTLSANDSHPTAWLSPVAAAGMNDVVELKLSPVAPGEWRREFTVALPGDYRVSLANESKIIHVTEQEYLSFGTEFGIFSGAVALLVGGMLLWLLKSKRKNNAGLDGSA